MKLIQLIIAIFFVAGFAQNSYASKTIGDILKKIEKKKERLEVKKQKNSLPEFKEAVTPLSKQNLRQVKPPSKSSLYYDEGTDEAQLVKITDEQIKQMYKLVQRSKRSSRRGELWLRLAELYVEKARLIDFSLHNDYDKKMQLFLQKKIRTRPRLNLNASKVYNKKAIKLYELFLKDFPKSKKVDQALFFLGYNYIELGKPKVGEKFYVRLAKEFPKSIYVDEASFALGEYYFENEKWSDAIKYYTRVTKKRRSRLFSFAYYKLAWCQYKTGFPKKAIISLEKVIYSARHGSGKKDARVSRIRLANESINDLIVFYSEVEDYKRARAYFNRVVGEKALTKTLSRLGEYYMDSGNFDAATYIFKDLMRKRPNSPKNFEYQYQIVKMYQTSGKTKKFRTELYTWIEKFGPKSVWQRANADKKDVNEKATKLIETTLRNYILQQHQTAQNSKAEFSRKMALNGYDLYFDTFKKTPHISEMHFFYAELLFDIKQYEKAAYHYLWIARNDKKSKYYKKALLNTILSLEKKLPTSKEIKKIIGKSLEPVEFDKNIKMFIKVSRGYIKAEPEGPNAISIEYRVGTFYYYYNQFPQALSVFHSIVEKHPRSKEAQYAANLILDIHNLKKDYDGLEKAADKLLTVPAIANSKLGDQIREIKAKTVFQKAEKIGQNKNYLKSAEEFERFAKANANNPLAISANYNAAINYEKAGQPIKAIPLYIKLSALRGKGNQKFARDAKKFLALIYEKTGQLDKASNAFESYYNEYPKENDSVDFLYNAAVIRDGLNQYSRALKNYQMYMDVSKKGDRYEVLFLMAKIWERREKGRNYNKAIHYYDQYISKSGNHAGIMEAVYSIAMLHRKLNRITVSNKWLDKTIATHRIFAKKGKNVGATYAAEAKFFEVEKIYNQMLAIRVPKAASKQSAAIQRKIAVLEKLKKELISVIKYDVGEHIVSALTLQGQALYHIYESFMSATKPKGLSPEELKKYEQGVMQLANPFKQQAYESFKTAVSKGFELEGYGEQLKVAVKMINKIDGKQSTYDYSVFITKLPDYME